MMGKHDELRNLNPSPSISTRVNSTTRRWRDRQHGKRPVNLHTLFSAINGILRHKLDIIHI